MYGLLGGVGNAGCGSGDTWDALPSPSRGACPELQEGVGEPCLRGGICLQIREGTVQQSRAISQPLPSLLYSVHVHLLACAISMSKLGL